MKVLIAALAALLIAGPAAGAAGDLEKSFQALKQAEANKDAAQVLTLSSETCALARKVLSGPAPETETEREQWKVHVAHAKEVEAYTEYALYATALQSQPETMLQLVTALEEQNPKSRYLDEGGYSALFSALHSLKRGGEIPAAAERCLKQFPNNEDALVVMMEAALAKKQMERAAVYAERAVAHLTTHPKPPGLSAADWERKRQSALGRSRWVAGVAHAEKNNYYEADLDLRAALPLIGGTQMEAPALFYLGIANYQLAGMTRNRARMMEAVKFSEQAAAMKGPYQQQAWQNAAAMKAEAAKLR